MKLFRTIRLTFYAFFISGLALAYYVYSDAISKPLEQRHLSIEVPKGVGDAWLAKQLEEQGVIENRYIFRLYKWMNNRDQSIKAGEYNLVDVDDIPSLVNKVVSGKVTQYAITLIEGKTFKEYRQQLAEQRTLIDQTSELSDKDIMRKLGAAGRHPEGMFAPQTYFFQKGDSDLDLLQQAFNRMQLVLDKAWASRDTQIKLGNSYELAILASIIEKETGAAHERAKIAGVFNNRLKIGMKLQTDPTVIYGMGENYDGNIRRRDLRTDTPYNTYTRHGLPPTPIAMAGEAAVIAAANPEATSALFFVGRGDGTHQFSETLAEHNAAVVKYQLGGKSKPTSSNPSGKL